MQNPPKTAQELVNWIHGARATGEKRGLENMRALLERLGHPERGLACLHVAGTNGKGSVCAFAQSALSACGLKTGLYTSPYLIRYAERIRIDGLPLDDESLARCGLRVYGAAQDLLSEQSARPTPFELGTALAFEAFREAGVDAAVIEVGLGGRLDPTNVITPRACAIANIGLDHTELLGGTLEKIALEKAGIIKPGVPVALYPSAEEAMAALRGVAALRGAPVVECAAHTRVRLEARGARFEAYTPAFGPMRLEIGLCGAHQVNNAALALSALSILKQAGLPLTGEGVAAGFKRAVWPGRLEWVGESLLVDGAHNPQGAGALAGYLNTFFPGRKAVLLTAMMRDKQPERCAQLLSPFAQAVVATQVDFPRALNARALCDLYARAGCVCEAAPDIPAALARAKALAGPDGLVIVAGSLYLAGEVLRLSGKDARM